MIDTIGLKEFEKKEVDWWCNHYRVSLRDLARRALELIEGKIDPGLVASFANTVLEDNKKRDKLV
jgi:hypothetical protein